MINFYYDPKYKYTNRSIIDISNDNNYRPIEYVNIDSPDSINGHIIYVLSAGEKIPTYLVDTEKGWRWFVSGITQLRTGKYQISLLRDLISENVELWKNENNCYISAGLATDYNKYKRWDLPFTNTKVKQERLNFGGKSSFFVYYVNEQKLSNNALTEVDLKINGINIPGIGSANYDYSVENLNDIPYFSYVNAGNVNCWTLSKAQLRLYINTYGRYPDYAYRYTYEYYHSVGHQPSLSNKGGGFVEQTKDNSITIYTSASEIDNNSNNCRTNLETAVRNFINPYQDSLGTTITSTEVNGLLDYVDKYIYCTGDSKVYTIRVQKKNINYNNDLTPNQTGSLNNAIANISFPYSGVDTGGNNFSIRGSYFTFNSSATIYNFTLEEIGTATSFDFNFTSGVRKLPRASVRCVNIVSDSNAEDSEIAQALMQAQLNATNGIESGGLSSAPTAGRIIDIQYLPFSIAKTTDANIKINNTPLTAQFLSQDEFTYYTDLPNLTNINKETDTIKIVSPSRASQFLFRPYDNDGNMEFTTKITLKPYTSIIYIRPSTKGLLINDWDDKDCLVINEDFSLTNVTSAWTQYIYNNKNYSNIFERQLQGREFERTWERRIEHAQMKSDVWSARNLSSQKAKAITGNLPIISNIAGAIANTIADPIYMQMAQLDREYNEALYMEGISLSRDLFTMQNENILAQPQIPSKITTIDCKFLDGVYLEYYSTNDTELNAIHNYYKYNGNRIDAYGSFAGYWGWFVRGKIIISNNYTQPEIDELNRRLEMGIFTEANYD